MPQPKETTHSASQDPISGSVFHQNMKIWSNSNTSENILILSALRFEKTEGRNTLSYAEMCCFKVRVFWICFHFRETFLGHFNIELFFLNLSYFSKKKNNKIRWQLVFKLNSEACGFKLIKKKDIWNSSKQNVFQQRSTQHQKLRQFLSSPIIWEKVDLQRTQITN